MSGLLLHLMGEQGVGVNIIPRRPANGAGRRRNRWSSVIMKPGDERGARAMPNGWQAHAGDRERFMLTRTALGPLSGN